MDASQPEDRRPVDEPAAAVLLAAGMSRRWAGPVPKQLLEVEGEALVRRTLRTLLAATAPSPDHHGTHRPARLCIVLGHAAGDVRRALDPLLAEGHPEHRIVCLHNPAFAQGQGTSVRCAVDHLTDTGVSGAFFVPVDQPWLDAELLRRLQAAHRRGYGKIIVPTHRGRRGAPVLFDRSFFPQLQDLEGDQGGRALLQRHPEAVYGLELESPKALEDIDTVDDLVRLTGSAL